MLEAVERCYFVDEMELFKSFQMENMQVYVKMINQNILELNEVVKRYSDIIIYGAGVGGKTVKRYWMWISGVLRLLR